MKVSAAQWYSFPPDSKIDKTRSDMNTSWLTRNTHKPRGFRNPVLWYHFCNTPKWAGITVTPQFLQGNYSAVNPTEGFTRLFNNTIYNLTDKVTITFYIIFTRKYSTGITTTDTNEYTDKTLSCRTKFLRWYIRMNASIMSITVARQQLSSQHCISSCTYIHKTYAEPRRELAMESLSKYPK